MRFTRTKGRFVFRLDDKETELLLGMLNHYPKIVSAPQPLTKTGNLNESEADQRLLNEALAAQRRENKQRLRALLENAERFEKTKIGSVLTLSASDIEWVLQILNDVRVGSWVLLGAPENDLWNFDLNESTASLAWTMESAGYFQMRLLEALEGRTPV